MADEVKPAETTPILMSPAPEQKSGVGSMADPFYMPPMVADPPIRTAAEVRAKMAMAPAAGQSAQASPFDYRPGDESFSATKLTAAEKLRAFEDEHIGEDAVRIGGDIERGVGSKYQGMTDDQRAHHTALENLVAAEKQLADATAALATAQANADAAIARHDAVLAKATETKEPKEADAPEAA
jgi:hypothetical protein